MSWQGKEVCKYGDGPWKNLGWIQWREGKSSAKSSPSSPHAMQEPHTFPPFGLGDCVLLRQSQHVL